MAEKIVYWDITLSTVNLALCFILSNTLKESKYDIIKVAEYTTDRYYTSPNLATIYVDFVYFSNNSDIDNDEI